MTPLPSIPIVVASGDSLEISLREALIPIAQSPVGADNRSIALLVDNHVAFHVAPIVASLIGTRPGGNMPGALTVFTARPPLHLILSTRFGRGAWATIDRSPPVARRDPVSILRSIAETSTRALVVSLPFAHPHRQRRPIAALAAFAHPRQRLAALLDSGRGSAAVDIAAAIGPSLVILVGHVDDRPLAVATTDLVAAELVWLALVPPDRDAAASPQPGPWEDTLVQRATQLDLGARSATQFRFVAPGDPDDPARRAFVHGIVEKIRFRLGTT